MRSLLVFTLSFDRVTELQLTRRDKLISISTLSAGENPEIMFQSKRIERKGKQLVAIRIFTMHGTSKEIARPLTMAS